MRTSEPRAESENQTKRRLASPLLVVDFRAFRRRQDHARATNCSRRGPR